jgi:tetratricopeptide (TPR) repeat protein
VHDQDFYLSWRARDEARQHAENLQILGRLLAARPDDPGLHLFQAQTLLAMDRFADSQESVHRAIEFGQDDAGALTRSASLCLMAGDLSAARECADRAKRIEPQGFPLKKDLREIRRYLKRQEKTSDLKVRLSEAFDTDPSDRSAAADLARHLSRTGRKYAAYHVVARGLHHSPDDPTLRRLERKLRRSVPSDERNEAERWAASGESRTLTDLSLGGNRRPGPDATEAERRQAEG